MRRSGRLTTRRILALWSYRDEIKRLFFGRLRMRCAQPQPPGVRIRTARNGEVRSSPTATRCSAPFSLVPSGGRDPTGRAA